jgi:hypothetical protein
MGSIKPKEKPCRGTTANDLQIAEGGALNH